MVKSRKKVLSGFKSEYEYTIDYDSEPKTYRFDYQFDGYNSLPSLVLSSEYLRDGDRT
jgi:hypothetical protein